ncbi:NADH:flavin oxidoreductase [Clostridium folliculivorans]|uniref:NADH:flavin oxidoreductase n=1 Tax=Clostridium folliculivorans TaxID=2886038 RepID=UPI0021C37375|nr:NADH:flavin oxidoreductase [Clostridium folliculivorans]GKU30501.1 oxidoreductase [Clostridium folliculivorans]
MKLLFDKTNIGKLELKNRFIRSATGDGFIKDGHPTEEMFAAYEELARGGVGTIITGNAKITDYKIPFFDMLSIEDDSFIPELKKFTDKVHAFEANIILQIAYFGSLIGSEQGDILGPSAVPNLISNIVPKEMSKEDIKYIQKTFASAALRSKEAGFDGVQLHAAHGFLLSQFLTPYYNHRTDEYGGTIENRARMLIETCKAVREMVGEDYPILIKINSSDAMEQGMTFEECKYVCKKLQEVGVNAVEISGSSHTFKAQQEAYFKDYAAEIAKEVDIPVIVVGGNRDYAAMEAILNETSIEYFSFSRPFIAESDFIKRWENGDTSRVKCVSCNGCNRPESMGRCVFKK